MHNLHLKGGGFLIKAIENILKPDSQSASHPLSALQLEQELIDNDPFFPEDARGNKHLHRNSNNSQNQRDLWKQGPSPPSMISNNQVLQPRIRRITNRILTSPLPSMKSVTDRNLIDAKDMQDFLDARYGIHYMVWNLTGKLVNVGPWNGH
jgi:hypothetical protein